MTSLIARTNCTLRCLPFSAFTSFCGSGVSILKFETYIFLYLNSIVPQPSVAVTLHKTAPLYAGTSLTLTCTVTLDPNVDSHVDVMTEWSGHHDISEKRYSVTAASISGRNYVYTGSLTISPLAEQDGGTYTCTVTITGGEYVRQANASNDFVIPTISKSPDVHYSACMRYSSYCRSPSCKC